MKILSPKQIHAIDQATIQEEGIASIELMERAARALARQFRQDFPAPATVHLFCGPGNNGGDGLALARLLNENEYTVHAYDVSDSDGRSDDNQTNLERLRPTGVTVHTIRAADDLGETAITGLIVDALVGSGLHSALRGLAAEAVRFINRQDATVVAIDMPSGLFADQPAAGTMVKASATYTIQLPKLALLLPENAAYCGWWTCVDIGLSASALAASVSDQFYYTLGDAQEEYLSRTKFSHKGSHGHALLIAGSRGKAGAAVLAARAALRSGVGLLTIHVPSALLDILQTSVPEAMCQVDAGSELFTAAGDIAPYKAIGIGPGLGLAEKTREGLSRLLDTAHLPMVVDADALNLLASHPELLIKLPPLSILTPHPGEFERLAGPSANDYDRLDKLRKFAAEHQVIVVLKGAHTAIARPDGRVSFNSTGNQGMATAGSGDTLTGLITGLLAQGYVPDAAARTGVFLHGLAGDLALSRQHPNSLIASDIIEQLGDAFYKISPNL